MVASSCEYGPHNGSVNGNSNVNVDGRSRHRCVGFLRHNVFLLLFTMLWKAGIVKSQQGNNSCNYHPAMYDDVVEIAGIFDTASFEWGMDVFRFTMEVITSGQIQTIWPDIKEMDIVDYNDYCDLTNNINGMTVRYDIVDAGCDETIATRAYWNNFRCGGRPPHGIIGARCSSASIAMARISGLEQVPQVSPSSTSAALSDDEEFPFFSRLVAPDNWRGEVGALVAMLRHFGWRRVTILSVDEQFSKDLTVQFRRLWESDDAGGEVGFSNVVRLNGDGSVNENSVRQVLQSVPVDDPAKQNSRVIVLAALNEHAFPVVRMATQSGFQPDTIWVGPSTFVARQPQRGIGSQWLPRQPGYLGVAPLRNTQSPIHQKFLKLFKKWQRYNYISIKWPDLPVFAAQMADSILALVVALHANKDDTRNGEAIIQTLRQLDFNGVSGHISFTNGGDLRDPRFSILHMRTQDGNDSPVWTEVGTVGTEIGSGEVQTDQLCFPQFGCGRESIPSALYPVPRARLPIRVMAVLVIFICLFFVVAFKYWRSWVSKQRIKRELDTFRDSVVGMRTAQSHYLPTVTDEEAKKAILGGINGDIEEQASGKSNPKKPKVVWCWKETKHAMSKHPPHIVGDLADCWIKYDDDVSQEIEAAFQKGENTYSPIPGYSLDFVNMKQRNEVTGFLRDIQRGEQGKKIAIPGVNGDIEDQASGKRSPSHKKTKIIWCWRETKHVMPQHPPEDIFGDPADCWIKYYDYFSQEIEAAFQKGEIKYSPIPGYSIDFPSMKQKKEATGFLRDIQRVVQDDASGEPDIVRGLHVIDRKDAMVGAPLPSDIQSEPQMVLVKGDIVQISKQRKDGWAFGTKLYHADEATARELVSHIARYHTANAAPSSTEQTQDDNNVFVDTGWFQLDATCLPSADDLLALQKNVGDAGALEAPSHWDPVTDSSKAELHQIQQGSAEYKGVVDAFMSTLKNRKVTIIKIERVQNLAMWQSYVVKRQTICNRETAATQTDNNIQTSDKQKAAQARFERKWLWHGSNVEVMDKILQQGFNRSFCGKNATMYGKGVYFSRDASYSSYKTYAVPDNKGHQYIMACRVAVGEYCVGRENALTPDVRDAKTHMLFDSTVGLLTGDTMARPSIYVTYHDAQAYPEYLIKFQKHK